MFASSFKGIKSFNSKSAASAAFSTYKESDFWEPQLRKLRGHGVIHSEKFVWPTQALITQFEADKIIRLCRIEVGMTSNLFEIRMCFTGGLQSPLLRAEGAGLQS